MKIYMKLRRKPPLPDFQVQKYCINRGFFNKKPSLTQHLHL